MGIKVKVSIAEERSNLVYKITIDDGRDLWQETYPEKSAAEAFLQGFEAAIEFAGIGDNVDIPSLPSV